MFSQSVFEGDCCQGQFSRNVLGECYRRIFVLEDIVEERSLPVIRVAPQCASVITQPSCVMGVDGSGEMRGPSEEMGFACKRVKNVASVLRIVGCFTAARVFLRSPLVTYWFYIRFVYFCAVSCACAKLSLLLVSSLWYFVYACFEGLLGRCITCATVEESLGRGFSFVVRACEPCRFVNGKSQYCCIILNYKRMRYCFFVYFYFRA